GSTQGPLHQQWHERSKAMDSRQRQARTAALVRVSVILGVVTGLLGFLGTPLAAAEPTHGGTLTVGLAADIAHFDVFHAIGYESYWALENIHSGLVRVDPQHLHALSDHRDPRAPFEDRHLLHGHTRNEVDLARPQCWGGGE